MSKQDVRETENMAAYWRRKLDWYTREATAEEYNEEEVRAIRTILGIIESESELDESYYNAEKGLERFRATLDMRLRIQDEMRRTMAGEVSLADYPEEDEDIKAVIKAVKDDTVTGKKIAKRQFGFIRNSRWRKVAMAASLVATLVIGGAVGAYAQREGFFRKLEGGEGQDSIITSPSGFETLSDKYVTYEDVNDIPINYVRFVWMPIGIPDDLSFSVVQIAEDDYSIRTNSFYLNEADKSYVFALKKNFKKNVVGNDQLHDGFEVFCYKTYDNIEVEYLIKENKDYTEYIVSFKSENCAYMLSTNLDFEIIEKMIEQNIKTKNF